MIRPEYRCNGLLVHGKCELEAVPVYGRKSLMKYSISGSPLLSSSVRNEVHSKRVIELDYKL